MRSLALVTALALGIGLSAFAQPVVNEDVKVSASDGEAGDHFAGEVAVSGDLAVVGSASDDDQAVNAGAAYLLHRNQGGPNAWGEVKKLLASDGGTADFLGGSVAIDGDIIVVGASRDNDNGSDSGSAYVFERNHGGADNWGQAAKLTASDGAIDDIFGRVAAISGDMIVVSAMQHDDNGAESGSVYVFERDAGGPGLWGQTAELLAPDGAAGDSFGRSAAIFGDTIVVGAIGDDDNGAESGSVYVFERTAGAWGYASKLLASDGAAGDAFGRSVGIFDDTIVVGANGDDDNGALSGSAYIFERSAGTWGQTAKLLPSDGASDDIFGRSVAIHGDTVVVASLRDDDNGLDSGAAYLFRRNEGGTGNWGEFAKLIASDGAAEDQFGEAVAVSDGAVIVGADADDDNGEDSGSAYIFDFDSAAPLTSDVIADPNPTSVSQMVLLSAKVDDEEKGDEDIVSAEYRIADSDGTVVLSGSGSDAECPAPYSLCPIAPDAAFDSATEHVEVSIPAGTLSPGVYEACIRGTDAAGNVGDFNHDGACTFLVVYDPDAGFVTGGGWIDSPAGAYKSDETLSGKANFGFVSKYKKGAQVPTGQTQFQFKTGDLNFHSDEYDWLVVAGAMAQYKGSGTVNGSGDYGFLLTARDSALNGGPEDDSFRIKIWNKNAGDGVVYDNGSNQPVGGGNIVIHE